MLERQQDPASRVTDALPEELNFDAHQGHEDALFGVIAGQDETRIGIPRLKTMNTIASVAEIRRYVRLFCRILILP